MAGRFGLAVGAACPDLLVGAFSRPERAAGRVRPAPTCYLGHFLGRNGPPAPPTREAYADWNSSPLRKAPMAQTPSAVTHTIEPLFDGRSRVLLLGTMPSPKSREYGFYYGHPRNRFWPVMARLWDEPAATTIAEKKALMLRHRLAVWDVLAASAFTGA